VELGESRRYTPMSVSGYEGENWVLADFVDVLLHVFSEEARLYYDLDGLWADARQVDWQPKAGE
jgi:ribosome-associated protein